MEFALRSPAFGAGRPIPVRYTADGENISPPLEWSDPPPGTKSFALIVEDPDAPSGMFYHWGLYNIAGGCRALPEGMGQGASTGNVGVGVNGFNHSRYDGPAPPKGHGKHRYRFRLFALPVEGLSLGPRASVADIERAARGRALAEAELVGTYQR
jgi:Raf kinase inhibitor-like YbhB/YbcL family protein